MSLATRSPSFPRGRTGPADLEQHTCRPLKTQDEHPGTTTELMTRIVKGAHETIDRIAQRATPSREQPKYGLAAVAAALAFGWVIARLAR